MNIALKGKQETTPVGVSQQERRGAIRHATHQKISLHVLHEPSANASNEGYLTEYSVNGARLQIDKRLAVGDRVYINAPRDFQSADSSRWPLMPPDMALTGRVVREVAANDSNVTSLNGYSFGVSFEQGTPRRSIWHRSNLALTLFVIALFIAGVANVAYLKNYNVEYFWYAPLINFYSLIISLYILSRFFLSIFYRAPADVGHKPSVTVIIACKNEEASIGRTIDCIYRSNYPRDRFEVIAVNDGSTDGTYQEMLAAQRRHPALSVINFEKNLGKRHGMAAGARAARGEILVYVDSDSFVEPNTIHKLVQGFHDSEVGAVCGHANVQNADTNILTKMQEVRYFVAFRVVKAAESLLSAVSCCSGCLAAYRRSYVMPILDHWLHQTFLGEEATFGDDRSLTNYMLRRYRVIYSADAVCTTLVPDSYRVFFRQQLRWKKSWIRESLIASGFMWRKNPLAGFFYYLGVLFPFIAPLIVLNALILPLVGVGTFSTLYIYGAILMSLLYSLVYLLMQRNKLWYYGILFSFFYMIVLVWQTYYALWTVRRNHWGTR